MSAAHVPTIEQRAKVEALSQYGIPRSQIAVSIAISEPTLRKHYAVELERGKYRANKSVAENLFAFASGAKGDHDVQARVGMFWAKTQMGWTERIDLSGTINIADGARERLAAKLGAAIPSRAAEAATALAHPIGHA